MTPVKCTLCFLILNQLAIFNVIPSAIIEAVIESEENYYDTPFELSDEESEPYNPDEELPTPEMIRRAGYPAETHTVQTDDGYLLNIHRIPNQLGHPVFIQHGLLSSSADWLMLGKNKALPYLLANSGYDVWLGNFRGNTYSSRHVNFSSDDPRFWNFSWHQMGIHDLPTMLHYVVNYKKEKVSYIGHSMGTTSSYVMAAERPDMHDKVHMIISLAPVAFMTHIKSPVRLFAPYVHDLELVERLFGIDKFLPQNWIIKFLSKYGCAINTEVEKLCENLMFAICGFDAAQFNLSLFPVITHHDPAGSSTKTIVHYLQEMTSKEFRQYDYGREKNMEIYHSPDPPDYNISNMNIPMAFFYSDNDWLAAVQDVKRMYQQIPKPLTIQRINFTMFNHLDFLWANDAPTLLYNQVIHFIDNFFRKFHNYEN